MRAFPPDVPVKPDLSPLCGSVHRDCSLAAWCPGAPVNSSPKNIPSFWRFCPLILLLWVLAPNKGSYQKGQSRGQAGLTWLCLLGDSWLDRHMTHRQTNWTNQTLKIWAQRGGHRKEKMVRSGSWDGFSAAHTVMRKQRTLGGQGKQESWADMKRETERKVPMERGRERK